MRELLDLFWTFARVGGLTFGGGYAMLPILQREMVEKRQWVSDEELMDYYAIGQCTPGIIAVNTATLCGTKKEGDCGRYCSYTWGCIPIAGDYYDYCCFYPELRGSSGREERFCGNPGLCLRFDP